ncbi:hypothetical protein BDR03DRAFT_1013906 [Suillus americanus]|nr:hypothetical protein BDR03DRAFT_1013906 [Suillus americanus]
MKKIRHALDMGNDDDLNVLNKELAAMEVNSDHEKDDVFNTGDSLGKALALIDQIRKSPQAHAFFKKACVK